jgi:signal transduction histidine kinase/DNA-binding response OmpR family regulator
MSATLIAGAAAIFAPSRILVVEDSATQAAALADLLTSEGFDVRVARSADAALAELERELVDLVLSDVVMPGMDGYELCRSIRATPALAQLPVVLLTSLSDPLAIIRGLAAGAYHYVTKPYEADALLTRIRHVLQHAHDPRLFKPSPVSVDLLGTPFTISATKEQILELLVSSYSDLVRSGEAVREAERRARFLAEAGELLSSSLDAHQVLRELAQLAVPRIADVCAVDLLDANGQLVRVEIAHSIAGAESVPAGAEPRPAEDAHGALVRALTERATQIVSLASVQELAEVVRDDALAARLAEMEPHSLLIVPLVARDRVLGALQFLVDAATRTHGSEDELLLEDLARRAALAVDNALLYGEAQRATRARDDVLAIVSHDLRNPLNTIQMATSFLLDMLETPGADVPLVSQLQIVRRATKRADALIQDLLDVSRIDAGTLAVTHAPIGAAQLLQDAVLEQQPLILAKGLILEHRWIGQDVLVAADRSRIGQVFSNLVGNAAKFTPVGGVVTIVGEVRPHDVAFEVRDTGAGIEPEHLPHLFDRFWMATQASRAGAGLGLFIVKGIVEAHGGFIEVASAHGEGTQIRFTLPRATATQSPATR